MSSLGLKANGGDEGATREREVKDLRSKIGGLVPDPDALKTLQALNDRSTSAF